MTQYRTPYRPAQYPAAQYPTAQHPGAQQGPWSPAVAPRSAPQRPPMPPGVPMPRTAPAAPLAGRPSGPGGGPRPAVPPRPFAGGAVPPAGRPVPAVGRPTPPAGFAETVPPAGTGPAGMPPQSAERWNALAIVSVVLVPFVAPVAAVLGVIAWRRVERRGGRGRGLAVTGTLLGSLATLVGVLAVVLVVASGAVSVHGGDATTPPVSGSTVASLITQRAGGAIQDVVCPDDLAATVGATTTCTATVDGEAATLQATTTSVAGGDVRFDVERVS